MPKSQGGSPPNCNGKPELRSTITTIPLYFSLTPILSDETANPKDMLAACACMLPLNLQHQWSNANLILALSPFAPADQAGASWSNFYNFVTLSLPITLTRGQGFCQYCCQGRAKSWCGTRAAGRRGHHRNPPLVLSSAPCSRVQLTYRPALPTGRRGHWGGGAECRGYHQATGGTFLMAT